MKLSLKLGLLAVTVAIAAAFGATQFGGVASAQVPPGTTKSCVQATATTATCTVTIPAGGGVPSGTPIVVQQSPTVAGFANASASGGTPPVSVTLGQVGTPPAGTLNAIFINCGTAGTTCQGPFTITETVNITPPAGQQAEGVAINQQLGNALLPQAIVGPPAPTGPFQTVMSLAGCFEVDEQGGVIDPVRLGTVEVGPGEEAFVECEIEINDNSPTPDLVYSGIVSVTVGTLQSVNPNVAAVSIANARGNPVGGSTSANVVGGTANVRCGAQNTNDSCDSVFVVVRVVGGPVASQSASFDVTITANYVPDNDQRNTPANLAATTAFRVQTATAVSDFINGTNFIIRCPAALNPALTGFPLLAPGDISGVGAIAVGILPSALICEAVFVDDDGDLERVAPGTIEVSALSGSLVDLAGRLTTNLRIGCGTATTVSDDLGTVNPNTCQGVRFGVLGIGVGFVEIRARYEPSSAAAAAGIREREATATVGFVAPVIRLDLALSPNPVVVGQTGTATLRFNRAFFFPGSDTLLIDPTTGIPIALNFGSPLNGTARFTSSNTAIASFVGAVTSTTGTSAGGASTLTAAGTTVTSSEAFVRCGGQTRAVTGGPLGGFFGGCDSVAVNYRGTAPGSTVITGEFTPDLPNALGITTAGGGPTGVVGTNLQGLLSAFGTVTNNASARTLEVVGVGPATTQRLVPGCNNVVAPANETVQQVAARVDPASAAISIWKQVPGTTTFQGAAIGGNVPAGVSNLTNVNALDAIFICVNAAATYRLT